MAGGGARAFRPTEGRPDPVHLAEELRYSSTVTIAADGMVGAGQVRMWNTQSQLEKKEGGGGASHSGPGRRGDAEKIKVRIWNGCMFCSFRRTSLTLDRAFILHIYISCL